MQMRGAKCNREREERKGDRRYMKELKSPTIDEFTTQYHPHSGRPPETQTSMDYIHKHPSSRLPPVNAEPWRPFFNTREDFEFAEILMEAGVSKGHSDRLLKLFKKCLGGNGTLTFSNHSDIKNSWDRAAAQLTPFVVEDISVPYDSSAQIFPVMFRPLWDWAVDLIMNPQLYPYFEWDAQRIFRRTGETTTRVYHEPWTGDAFWNIQSQIPQGARPLCFILYADKTNLSSFGTAKAYPVVARCANLPASIRNSNGIGGGRVIGWLPIIPETPEDTRKAAFVKFKREVWHRAFRAVIASIIERSVGGCWLQCSDGTQQQFFPAIIILSADYEEQCTMSLNRGSGGHFPCSICLAPKEQFSDVTKTWPLRDAVQTQNILKDARAFERAQDCNNLLSLHGLRDIDNVFWLVANSDPHRALSFDRLHSNNTGLFGYHLWEKFKVTVNRNGRNDAAKVDQQFGLAPRWRGLNRFPKVMKVSFADGAKLEDISKNDQEEWLLMRCLRSFSILDLLLAFEVHTDESIAAGRDEVSKFGDLIKVVKDWNFPKLHALVHSFDDIVAKGVTRNYNTKPNEKLHSPLKKAYMRTNFKDVAAQILKIDHFLLVGTLIQGQIDEVDAAKQHEQELDNDETEVDAPEDTLSQKDIDPFSEPPSVGIQTGKTLEAGAITLGSQQPSLELSYLETLQDRGPLFSNFREKLSKWLTDMFKEYHYQFPPGCDSVKLQGTDKITEYRSIKVCYESKVDSQQYLDYLHCSPNFHHVERRDFVIVKTTSSFIFAQLLFIFTCSFDGNCFPICFARPLDGKIRKPRPKDQELRLHRVRARSKPTFFFIRSIDFDRMGDYFVMDVVDHSGDLFIRCNEIFGR
ncbi:hypothetical protein V8E53_014549 [Lactarius tabidus]